ncbi:LysR substrate-binding domain-containing protein [Klebsiella pneumoniae]
MLFRSGMTTRHDHLFPAEYRALESHQLVTVGRMVASGLGGSAVPALCKTQMASLGAVCIPLSDPPIEKCVGAIHAGHLPLSKAAQALLDTLKGFLPT